MNAASREGNARGEDPQAVACARGLLLCNGVVNHALLLIAHHEGLALVRHLLLRLLDAVTRRIRLRAQPRDAAAAAAAATAASRDWVNGEPIAEGDEGKSSVRWEIGGRGEGRD